PFVNPYAAVPSLHVGRAALLAISVWLATDNPWVRVIMVSVFVLQTISVIATGNHFLFDGLAGLLVCAPALALALWMQTKGYRVIRCLLWGAMERFSQPVGTRSQR
ncbi:MAG TPA: phosphatase PAP2 family protein, partial [Dehalococcoidia bacterium]|nr:phosphatase PAP2 family protein [Dehalococcoidia bacterium]